MSNVSLVIGQLPAMLSLHLLIFEYHLFLVGLLLAMSEMEQDLLDSYFFQEEANQIIAL